MKRPTLPADGIVGDTALREAATTELQQVIELIRGAVRVKAALREGEWVHVVAVYPDRVVIQREGRLYAYAWTLDESNRITLGEPAEVVLDHKPVNEPLREGWFVEAAAAEAGKPTRYLVRVIRAGTSLNGVTYPAKVLREAAPLFSGVRVFAKPDEEHVRGGGKDFAKLVGRLVEAKYHNESGGEIRAVLEVLESSDVAAKLREAVANGMTDLFGLSIDAAGASKTTGKFREAISITKVASVDLIIEPGAGGQVIRFVEAHQEQDMLRQQMIDVIRAKNAKRADELADASDNDILAAYREAVQPSGAGQDAGAATGRSAAPASVSPEELAETVRMVEARADAKVRIGMSDLPQLAKQKLLTRFAEAASFKAEDVDAAIKAETDYIASFRESAPIQGLGGRVEIGESVSEKIQKGLDGFFARDRNGFRSFREAYVAVTGDAEISGQFRNCDESRLREAAGAKFREAVSASTFSDILGDSITRAMLREYGEDTRYGDWRDLVDVVPIRDFRTNERTRMGGYGNLPAVAENGPYDALATPGDEKATYAISKRGGTETISLEAIANDDVGAIRRIPMKLATAARRTLYEFVLGFLDANPLIYDGLALFVGGHNNLGTAALDATTFAAARLRMQKQAEAGSAKRLGLAIAHLYIPSDLEEAAYNLFVRNSNNDETFVQSRKPKTHVVPHWTDVNNWFVTADQADVPLIELGFYGGQEEPELFVQDNPTQGSLFSNDQIKYKIRHIYGGNVMDFRGFDGSIVA